MSRPSNELDDILVQLEDGVRRIMSYPPETLDLRSYLRLYTLIHNYCTAMKTTNRGERGTRLQGEEMYDWLNRYLKRHLLGLHTEMVAQPESALTTFYLERWRCYKAAAAYNARLFRFLDRHWVKREVDEGRTSVHDLYTLHLIRWKEDVLENAENPVKAMLQQHLERTEESWIVVSPDVPELLESFASLDISVDSSD